MTNSFDKSKGVLNEKDQSFYCDLCFPVNVVRVGSTNELRCEPKCGDGPRTKPNSIPCLLHRLCLRSKPVWRLCDLLVFFFYRALQFSNWLRLREWSLLLRKCVGADQLQLLKPTLPPSPRLRRTGPHNSGIKSSLKGFECAAKASPAAQACLLLF